jgi:hypothetical protein
MDAKHERRTKPMLLESTLPPLVGGPGRIDLTARLWGSAIHSVTPEEILEQYFEGAEPHFMEEYGLDRLLQCC